METKENLILIKEGKTFQDKTKGIRCCKYNSKTSKYDIIYNSSNKVYTYNYNNVIWLNNPEIIDPSTVIIYKYQNHKVLNNIIYIANFDNRYIHIIYNKSSEKTYNISELKIEKSCLVNKKSREVFNYLKNIASEISVKTKTDCKILAKQYESMQNFISDNSIAAKYLNPSNVKTYNDKQIVIFPFGTNASQTKAVYNALTNDLSIIEGPPGTGKTQTILNIIANLIMRGKTVQVVSNNNSATENIYEKLCKYGYGFLIASLGRKTNKQKFITNQTGKLPDISSWKMDQSLLSETILKINKASNQLNSIFENKNKLAYLKQELSDIKTEQVYFEEQCNNNHISYVKCKSYIKSSSLLKLWTRFEIQNNSVFNIISFIFCFGLKNKKLVFDISTLISTIKQNYYIVRISELKKQISKIEDELNKINSKEVFDNYVKLSSQVFNNFLYKKYGSKVERKIYKMDDFWKNPKDVVEEYPIILSTTYSSRSNLGSTHERFIFDYIIMDEASQIDVATGTLALSVAKNAVIVGDRKQLPNVVSELDKKETKEIFSHFEIDNGYDFSKYSFLTSVYRIIPNIPNILLREHYRCHPKIIGFCNKEFYDNQLLIMTNDNGEKDVLKVHKTVKGNHAREHINQRQIDEITQNILPNLSASDNEIGIIAPYRAQVNQIIKCIDNKSIFVETVHKFQGREKNNIIMSTTENVINSFLDNPNLLNVAVSRAINRFDIIIDSRDENMNTRIGDLVKYIEYNNFEVTESNIYSIFDYLYKQYQDEKRQILATSKKVSIYDSENLMYNLIQKILKEDYNGLDVITHLPLKEIFKNFSKLNESEYNFVVKTDSHVDFMIYNKVSKMPVLAIEVDGYDNHKEGTHQFERDQKKNNIFNKYSLPLMRFKTNGSREEECLIKKLNELM